MAEREVANPLSDPYPQSSNSKRQNDPRLGTRFQGIISPVLPFLGHKISQKSDPELGANGVRIKRGALPPGYPKFAAFLDPDENFMVYRRFSSLHAQVLLYAQDEIDRLERRLRELDEIDRLEQRLDELDENSRKREESTSRESRD